MSATNPSTLHVTRRRTSLWVFVAVAVVDLGGALFITLQPFMTAGEVLLVASAATIGLAAALSFARALDATGGGSRAVWISRGVGLLGAAIAVWFPAILFGELRDSRTGTYTPIEVVRGEITASAFDLVYGLIPIVVALRFPVAGGVLFLLNAVVGFVLGAFDPFGSFPERAVGPSVLVNTIPPLIVGLALIFGGLAMRDAPKEPPFGEWLRRLVRGR